MTDNAKKVSEVPQASNVASTDRVLILRDPSGNASVRTVTMATFSANLVLSNTVPANSSSNGIKGTICNDSSYVYICVANNTWKRAELTTW